MAQWEAFFVFYMVYIARHRLVQSHTTPEICANLTDAEK